MRRRRRRDTFTSSRPEGVSATASERVCVCVMRMCDVCVCVCMAVLCMTPPFSASHTPPSPLLPPSLHSIQIAEGISLHCIPPPPPSWAQKGVWSRRGGGGLGGGGGGVWQIGTYSIYTYIVWQCVYVEACERKIRIHSDLNVSCACKRSVYWQERLLVFHGGRNKNRQLSIHTVIYIYSSKDMNDEYA